MVVRLLKQDSCETTSRFLKYSREAFRGAMVLLEQGAISRDGFNGPYSREGRQKGFVNYGNSHVLRLLGTAEVAQRSSWYQKWNVHLFPRPEVSCRHYA